MFNPMIDLFAHGTTVFIDVTRGMLFCTQGTAHEHWPSIVGFNINHLPGHTPNSKFCVHLAADTALIYLGLDKTQDPAHIQTSMWAHDETTALFYPHAFLWQGKLLIKPIMWDQENYRPHGAVRGLFYTIDD